MKKRILTISLIVASLVLLVSVGFAGWVISQPQDDNASGTFQAYSISETGSLTVKTSDSSGNLGVNDADITTNIIFGKDTSATPTNSWLQLNDNDSEANLIGYVKVIYSQSGEYESAVTFNATHTFSKTVSNVLIGGPQITMQSRSSSSDVDFNDSTDVISFTGDGWIVLKVTYSFGSAFNSQNPYQYFNNHLPTDNLSSAVTIPAEGTYLAKSLTTADTYRDLAFYALRALDALVDGMTFTVTISATA